MKRFFKSLVTLLKDIWYVIKGMLSLRGLLALFISFMIYQGWAYVFIILGPFMHSAWMITTGTAVILAWFGPGTPAIPLIVITALLIQRFIFRERNPRYDAFMKKYKGILNERKRRKNMKHLFGFGEALKLLKEGKTVARQNWNAPNQKIYLVPAASYPAQTAAAKEIFGGLVPYRAYLVLVTAQKDAAPWVPSISDCLAEDWYEATPDEIFSDEVTL